ncbi:hypothetical protein [Polymorphospora sp. A560]|uniref:hypothetical protein n=1 Tax=Polymorphospora sp. A560 TaxID=3040203 RepID=UPI0038929456
MAARGTPGRTTLAQGRPVSALRWLREAHAGLERFDTAGGFEHVCLIPLGRALALTGDLAAAADVQARLHARQHPMVLFLQPDLYLSRAWLAAAQGVSSEAVALAHEAASVAAATGHSAHEVLALHTAVCFGDRSVAARLTALAARVDGPRPRPPPRTRPRWPPTTPTVCGPRRTCWSGWGTCWRPPTRRPRRPPPTSG